MTGLIPKQIHYCWLSGGPLNQIARDCMETWKRVLPDYELVLWDQSSFDVSSVPFVKEAVDAGKWAFAADYIRLFSVHQQGGIYLDTDVRVLKSFDPYLTHQMFIPIEYHPNLADTEDARAKLDQEGRLLDTANYANGIGLQAAIFGATAGHPFLRECMAYYESRNLRRPDGTYYMDPVAPAVYAKQAERHGFVYRDKPQELDCGVTIVESSEFASRPDIAKGDETAIHWCAGSWRDRPSFRSRVTNRLKSLVGAY